MQFSQYLLILKARYKIILLTFLIVVVSTLGYNLSKTKEYKASVSLVLNYKGADPVTGVVLPAQLAPGYMATQIDIITSRKVAVKVVKALGLSKSDQVQAQFIEAKAGKGDIDEWLAERLQKNLDVIPSRESSVIQIVYSGNAPEFVALVANAFAKAYQETSVELKVDPAKQASVFLGGQISDLKQQLEAAQSKLSKYQQKHGITNTNQSYDVEMQKLNELSSQLVAVQAQLYDSKSRGISSGSDSNSSPDVTSSGLVQNLKLNVALAETRLSELSERYGRNHPAYLSAKAELNKHKNALRREISTTAKSINKRITINRQKEKQLKDAYQAQKDKILKLNATRDELKVLENEVMSAQKALDLASTRFNETNQESNSNQSDITILNHAIAPDIPSSPRIIVNVVLSIFIGTILGVMLGLLVELLNRKVRSQDDVAELLEIPVFSISNKMNQQTRDKYSIIDKSTRLLGAK